MAITHLGGAGVWLALLALAAPGALGAGAQTLVALAALIGFGTKAGLVPLHTWLPLAHPVAPAPFSALMSGMMVKVALYGLIRVEFEWLGAPPRWLGLTLLAAGLLSALGGVLWALFQQDLKRLLAYSTIENVGIAVTGLGASTVFPAGEKPKIAGQPPGSAVEERGTASGGTVIVFSIPRPGTKTSLTQVRWQPLRRRWLPASNWQDSSV